MTLNTIQIRKKGSITLPMELRAKYGLSVENTVARVKAQFAEAAPAATRLIGVV